MILAIDIGNTHITLGAFSADRLAHTWRLKTDRHYTSDELGILLLNLLASRMLDASSLTGVAIASVVPSLDHPIRQATRTYLRCVPVMVGDPHVKLGVQNLYEKPEEVGADRLINALAVHRLYKRAAIVVDFGTATTFDCVSAKGEYLGGAICPGIELAGEALATRTAKLPRITFQDVPSRALGQTTKESLQSGLFWGYIGLVDGLLRRLKAEMKGSPVLIVTGGLAPVIGPKLRGVFRIAPDLTLDGLRMFWEQNKKGRTHEASTMGSGRTRR